MTQGTETPHTIYGSEVGLIKNRQIYLSRRTENVVRPKKWQLVHGVLRSGEQSMDAAIRILHDQTGLLITDKRRMQFVQSISTDDKSENYFLYLLNLEESENPQNTCERFRGDWRLFELEKAEVLDVLEGVRGVLKKLLRTRKKYESFQKYSSGILSEGEALKLAKLGPRMTRLV